MADGIVQLAPDGTGKKMDTEELTVGANTVQRERVQISGAAAAAIAAIKNTDGAAADYGLVVRPVQGNPGVNKVWAYGDLDSLRQEATSIALKSALYGADGNPIAVAHDAVDSGYPLLIGGRGRASPPAAVSAPSMTLGGSRNAFNSVRRAGHNSASLALNAAAALASRAFLLASAKQMLPSSLP